MIHTRKALAMASVTALLATGVFAGTAGPYFSPSAVAQEASDPQTPALAGLPETANLHVHKFLGQPGTEGDGTQETLSGDYDPAGGVTFYAHRVNNVNLRTQDGWAQAAGLEINSFFGQGTPSLNNLNTDDPRLDPARSEITQDNGAAVFDNLDIGVYLVVEEPNPTTGPAGNEQALTPAAPFLVTVPMTNPDTRTGWLETVHVYPKGQAVTAPVKTIGDPLTTEDGDGTADLTGSSVGELIGYRIEGEIPAFPEAPTGFVITDRLPVELGQPAGEDIAVTLGDTPLTAGTDYDLYVYQLADGAWVIRVELTGALASLPASAGGTITLDFTAPVATTPQGALDNQAWILPSDPNLNGSETWDPLQALDSAGTASNLARSTYGEITIIKTNQDGDTRLPGAEFQLFRCNADGTLVNPNQPIQVSGTTTSAPTDDNGVTTISGIHLSNQAGTDSYTDLWATNGTQFCLVETVAPEGYALLPQPVPVNLTYTTSNTALVNADAPIENVEANAGFQLPLTGGMGIWLIIGGGVLLLIIAAIYYAITRKRIEE